MSRRQDEPLRSTIRAKGQVTLPNAIRRKLNLKEGDDLLITEQGGRVILTPAALIPRDQTWFWTEEWQAGEIEAERQVATGAGEFHASDEEFLAALEAGLDDAGSAR